MASNNVRVTWIYTSLNQNLCNEHTLENKIITFQSVELDKTLRVPKQSLF